MNPKEKCEDCGGADAVGLCASGDKAGCPCDEEEEQECPETPPKCSDVDCGGDNGQSQCSADGKINGCLCCPDTPPSCFDTSSCNGDGGQVCTADKYKGCSCSAIIDGGVDGGAYPFPGFAYDSMSVTSLANKIFKTYYHGDSASVPGWSTSAKPTSVSSTTTSTQAPAPTESLICGKPKTPHVMFNTFGTGPG
jgi:hypothetical protein